MSGGASPRGSLLPLELEVPIPGCTSETAQELCKNKGCPGPSSRGPDLIGLGRGLDRLLNRSPDGSDASRAGNHSLALGYALFSSPSVKFFKPFIKLP